jgi:hypothetical protein
MISHINEIRLVFTGNIGYPRRRKTKQKHNTICVGHHYMQTNTNNVNKSIKQTYGGENEPNFIIGCENILYVFPDD